MCIRDRVRSGTEELIRKQCEKLVGGKALEKCFIPYYEEMKRYQGEWPKAKKILFPGYVFDVSEDPDCLLYTSSARDTNPETARAIADEMASVSVARIAEIMDSVPPKIVEEGNLPTAPSSPNVRKNTVLGGLAAGIAAAGIIILLYLMNDSIRNAGDIERYLDLNTLGQIPEFEENQRRKKKKSKWGRRAVE